MPNLIWQFPPAAPVLGPDEIHVWCASLDQPVESFRQIEETLAPAERGQVGKIHTALGRQRFAAGRGLLRLILSRYVECAPEALAFDLGVGGKPALRDQCGGQQIGFNVARSGPLALYAVGAPGMIGVDLEQLRAVEGAAVIARHFFSDRERREIGGLPAGEQIEAFFNCWTRREAFLKAIGQEIRAQAAPMEVSLAPGEPSRLLSIGGDDGEAARWSIHALAPVPGYVGALAVRRPVAKVSCWMWAHHGAAGLPGIFRVSPDDQRN